MKRSHDFSTRLAFVLASSLAACGLPSIPPSPSNAEVFESCEVEMLCPGAVNEVEPNATIEMCTYEALRDRTPGRVAWQYLLPECCSDFIDVFIGADGRVLAWYQAYGQDDGTVMEVSLRPPEFFSECIAGIAEAQPPDCITGHWFVDEGIAVEASCVELP